MAVSRLTIEYDGSGFAGWAAQGGAQRTVQHELEQALAVVLREPQGSDAVQLTVAGRTDAGVHALEQVASYAGPPTRVEGLNALLPDDVAVLSCVAAQAGFNARFDATSRAYCYLVLARPARSALQRGRALHWPYAADVGVLRECAAALVGVHDFTAFTPTATDHVRFTREVYGAEWRVIGEGQPGGAEQPWGVGRPGAMDRLGGVGRPGAMDRLGGVGRPGAMDRLEFWIEADAFMRHMNRVLVGTMLEVAAARRSVAEFVRLLDGVPRSAAGATAPAHGLYLAGVGYGGERVIVP
ncbi:MAG: tRNA pseudouridine synthase A [Solirubrobacteraceae bacterium]